MHREERADIQQGFQEVTVTRHMPLKVEEAEEIPPAIPIAEEILPAEAQEVIKIKMVQSLVAVVVDVVFLYVGTVLKEE